MILRPVRPLIDSWKGKSAPFCGLISHLGSIVFCPDGKRATGCACLGSSLSLDKPCPLFIFIHELMQKSPSFIWSWILQYLQGKSTSLGSAASSGDRNRTEPVSSTSVRAGRALVEHGRGGIMGQWVSSLNSRMFFEGHKTMDMTFFGTPEHLGLESRIVGQVADISVTRLICFNKNCYLATKDEDKICPGDTVRCQKGNEETHQIWGRIVFRETQMFSRLLNPFAHSYFSQLHCPKKVSSPGWRAEWGMGGIATLE